MYRLLIVDDEPIIVDGMFELFQEQDLPELELYRAYSGKEALKQMGSLRIDIVLSDIGMPKIDGFQLQQETKRLWPHCKFIFLTSHNDFHYAQTALRNGSTDFILKTEEDDNIVASVRNALASLEEEQINKDFIARARQQMQMAVPLLRKDYLASIHDGTVPRHLISDDVFHDMQIAMASSSSVLPVIGRVDDWGHYDSKSDRTLMTYAIENMLAEFFAPHCFQFAATDKSYFALFVQPADIGPENEEEETRRWEQIVSFVKGTLEAVQPTIGSLLKLSVSLSIGLRPAPWHELHLHFESLRKQLMRMSGTDRIVTEDMPLAQGGATATADLHHAARTLLKKIGEIEFANAVQHEQFVDLVIKLKGCLDTSYNPALFAEIYFSIASHLITYMNRWETAAAVGAMNTSLLEQFEINRPYTLVLDEFIAIAAALIREKENEQRQHNHQVIHLLHQYIADNIDKELSLNRLSEIVFLNPVYLSRLYKMTTGAGLVDYINEVRLKTAKQALIETNAKIHDIARSVGFESPTYFARLFKRNEGMTPQEYREKRL